MNSIDSRIQQAVVANLSGRPNPVESGPFVLGLDPSTESLGINYGTPRPGAAVTAADVDEMVAAFRAHDRLPRLEYVISAAPELESLLLAAGFEVEERHDYLICPRGELTVPPTPEGFTLRSPSTDPERRAMVSAQNEAFGGGFEASPADADRVARLQARGGVAVMAIAEDGACAGGGTASPAHDGVSEVAGIAVRPQFRRRGLAGAVTAAITEVLDTDVAWLEASGEDAWRVYERVGFRPAGKRLYISLPKP